MSTAPLVPDVSLRIARARWLGELSEEALRRLCTDTGSIDRVTARDVTEDGLAGRFVHALAERRAVPTKEVLEALEFFAAVRSRAVRAVVADLCAGHGLVGALFALYERDVEQVWFVDKKRPASRDAVFAAAEEVGPWTRTKWVEREGKVQRHAGELPRGASVVAVHACGLATDACIEAALAVRGPVALLPCCRPHGRSPAPAVLARELGDDTAFDVDRTYRLEAAGYTVRWDAISGAVTPQNRVIQAWPRADRG